MNEGISTSTPNGSHRMRRLDDLGRRSHEGFAATRMERLWSLAGATSGNRRQVLRSRKRLKQAKTVATGCDQLPIGAHGKEEVDDCCHDEFAPLSMQAPSRPHICHTGCAGC